MNDLRPAMDDGTVAATRSGNGGVGMVPAIYRLQARRREVPGVYTLRVAPAESGACPPDFAPGQFAMLYASGIGEAPISIAARGRAGRSWLFTIRDVGPVTHALVAGLNVGAEIGLRGPFGTAWPLAQAQGADLLLVAGGIGLAPLRGVLEAVWRSRPNFGRVTVLYGGRNPEDLLYARWLSCLGRRGIEVQQIVDRPDASWSGPSGRVTALLNGLSITSARFQVMTCGPEIMMKGVVHGLIARGVAPDAIAVSLERGMRCGLGFCGHCQLGPYLLCSHGPVLNAAQVAQWWKQEER